MKSPSADDAAKAGQAVYTRPLLSVYDLWVLGISNSFIWKCPTRLQRAHYRQHLAREHLDVGVGTGYYLDKCQPCGGFKRLGLLDMNQNSLDKTINRVRRHQPKGFRANILEPLDMDARPYQSVAVNYLLHCLPGNIPQKAVIFDYLNPYLDKGGSIFGATLLSQGVHRSDRACKLMAFYNEKGIFSNTHDSLEDLSEALASRYPHYSIEVTGCCALFSATRQ